MMAAVGRLVWGAADLRVAAWGGAWGGQQDCRIASRLVLGRAAGRPTSWSGAVKRSQSLEAFHVAPHSSSSLLIGFSDYLTRAGRWRQWVSADQRLAGFDSLDSILEGWRGGDRSEDLYQAVSAAAALGSRRGADDSDAAVALLVLLQDGIVARGTKLAMGSQRHRPADEVIDGVLLALCEQVRMSAPNLGCRGPAFLLARACRQAIRDAKPVAAALVAAEAMAWGTPFAAFARGAARKPCGRGGGARGLSAVIDDLVARTASRSPELS